MDDTRHLSLDDLQQLVRTAKPTDVIRMKEGALQASGPRGTSDATLQLLSAHHISMEEPAKAAAMAVRKILREAGHQAPASDTPITADILRAGLNSIGERQYSGPLSASVCTETAHYITNDIAADTNAPPDAEPWRQMQMDFLRCDMSLNGINMSLRGGPDRFAEMRTKLEEQPEQVQRFIRNACHQGSIAAAFSAASRALHRDHAVLPAAMKDKEFDIETSFHVDLDDPMHPSVIIYHERHIAAASAMSDAAGMGVDVDNAPRTNADSLLYFHIQISLDTRSNQVSVSGQETIDISYASPRALKLDDAVYPDTDSPDEMGTLVRGMQGYAALLIDARATYLNKHPDAGSDAVADFERDWHINALHDLARYRGESIDDVASRVAATCRRLTGQFQEEETILEALVAQGHLSSTDKCMARDIVEQCSPLQCVRGLVKAAVEQTNNALPLGDSLLSTPAIMPTDRTAAVHPRVTQALKERGYGEAAVANPAQRHDMPVPPVQRQLSTPDDPALRIGLLSGTTTLITSLLSAADSPRPDAVAQWLLSPSGDDGSTGLQQWIDQSQSLLQHGIQTLLPLDMQRFAYEQLHDHVQRTAPDGARASDMLDTLLHSGIPEATGRSRDAYLAFCQVVAGLLYTTDQRPLELRKGLRDSSINAFRRHALEREGQPANGKELMQLLPALRTPLARLFPGAGSWSSVKAVPPPPPEQNTGAGDESVTSINAHLIALLKCTQQIIAVTLSPSNDTPLPVQPVRDADPAITTPQPR